MGEKIFNDMKDKLAAIQVSGDMDSNLAMGKTNMDKLLTLAKDISDRMKESNTKLVQVCLTMFCDITKELSGKIKEAMAGGDNSKAPREIFNQPHVKAALAKFSEQLDWVTKMLEDYMKENNLQPVVNGSGVDSKASEEKKKGSFKSTSRLSFKKK